MTIRYETSIIFRRKCPFPYQLRYKVLPAKHLITNLLQIFLLIIINRYKNNPIIRQQIPRQHQP